MAEATTLETLQSFHRELVAVSEHRFEGLEFLDPVLIAHADIFKQLVDKNPRKQESRKAVESGKITIKGEEYAVNKEFQENTLQLADELDLDEVETALLLLDSEDDTVTLDRPLLECGLIRFHQQRKYLLDCMRLCIQLADDEDLEPSLQAVFGEYVSENIYGAPLPGQHAPAAERRIVPRCMAAMHDIRMWLQKLTDRATATSVLQGRQKPPPEVQEMFEFSHMSLVQQHEGLAIVLLSAVEKRHTEARDFEELLKLLQRLDRYDCLLIHLFPTLAAYIRIFGSPDGVSDLTQARRLNEIISRREEDNNGEWQIVSLRAAVCAWWIAEYSGWYMDDIEIPLDNIDVDREDKDRSDLFSECLKEGALDFILAVSSDVEIRDWQDPTPSGVQVWMQRKCPPLPVDSVPFADHFRIRVLEQLENFVDAFISNLPDVIRQLRIAEDEQRQLSQLHEQSLELERFLLIISSAYEGRAVAAETFWSDPESNLAGFMQWASHRASTPLVSAFCEMLRSISGNETSAGAAHAFLMGEIGGGSGASGGSGVGNGGSTAGTGRIRKSQSLTWVQVVRELDFFTVRIRTHTSQAPALLTHRSGKASDEQEEVEPESAIMLECYLRLIARISANSPDARFWLLQNSEFSLVSMLFQLASLPIPGSLRARIFTALKALLVDKSLEISNIMWTCLDDYMSGAYVHATQNMPVTAPTPSQYMDGFLIELTQAFDQPYAFVQFLLALTVPAVDQSPLHDALPFPETLGASTRMSGIDPYVDFVMSTVLAKHTKELNVDQQQHLYPYQPHPNLNPVQQQQQTPPSQQHQQHQQSLRLAALDFALTCLETFNEDLILIANETSLSVDSVIATSDLAAYVRLHPFARVMEWMYNHSVVEAIFLAMPEDTAQIGSAAPDSPLILGVIRAVELVSKILDLQDTYLDLVRQVIRLKIGDRRKPVSATYSFFEEAIANRLDLIVSLGSCCGLGHPTLALACLKLLEKVSTSPKVISAWNHTGPGQQHAHRNKAIVALERDGEAAAISGAFISEMVAPLDPGLEIDAPNYSIKCFMLDFLFACLQASPNQPTIAHLILGFKCGIDALSVEPGGAFDERTSLFHNLLRVLLEAPFGDDQLGMRHWLILLKHKIMRIFQVLWRSPLSSAIVLADLRENNFAFHLMIREVTLQPELVWDGLPAAIQGAGSDVESFYTTNSSIGFIEFWAVRAMTLEYIGMELCSVSQNRMPSLKRRIFDALNGQVLNDSGEPITTPTVFELFDFMSSSGTNSDAEVGRNDGSGHGNSIFGNASIPLPAPPNLKQLGDIDLRASLGEETMLGDALYDLDKARELILLKEGELMQDVEANLLTTRHDAKNANNNIHIMEELRDEVQREEMVLLEYLSILNRQKQLASNQYTVLQAWTKLLLVMFEVNEFAGTAQVSFLLQALQAILPGLEAASTDHAVQAAELAKLAEALLFKLGSPKNSHGSNTSNTNNNNKGDIAGEENRQMSSLVSDKLFQLFQICLHAIGKWVGGPELRTVYYNICYRYVAGLVDHGLGTGGVGSSSGIGYQLQRVSKAVRGCSDRLLNVVCDDAYGSDAACQSAALVLLGSLVRVGSGSGAGKEESGGRTTRGVGVGDYTTQVVEGLNRLNFVGVLVDSLRTTLQEGLAIVQTGSVGAKLAQEAKLALLLQLCQTREGAKHVLQANLFRAVELSGLFAADPELQAGNPPNMVALVQHYALLVQVARVISAAVVSRGSHNAQQGRRFLAEHRMLVMHVLKRSAGIGGGGGGGYAEGAGGGALVNHELNERIEELADAFMVLIVATDFLEFEEQAAPMLPAKNSTKMLFH